MPAVVQVTPKVSRANVDWTLDRMADRVGNEYVYGGWFDPVDINVGCDCSALVAFVCNGVLYGNRATWKRVDGATGAWITTESWRPVEVGDTGPFGSITVASAADIPDDAAVKIALHHGPGGGAASHTWCEVDGHRFESNGSRGCVTGNDALPIDSPYANDWAYIPGPIDSPTDCGLWDPNNEPGSPACGKPTNGYRLGVGATGVAVIALQAGMARVFPAYCANLPITGLYDGATVAAVAEFQRRLLSVPSGIVDDATRGQLAHYGVILPDTGTAEGALIATPAPAPTTDPPPPLAPVPDHFPAAVITYPTPEPEPEPKPHHELLAAIVDAVAQLAALFDGK